MSTFTPGNSFNVSTKGISADRMSTFGEGKDMSVDQKDIYTEKARKVEVKKHE